MKLKDRIRRINFPRHNLLVINIVGLLYYFGVIKNIVDMQNGFFSFPEFVIENLEIFKWVSPIIIFIFMFFLIYTIPSFLIISLLGLKFPQKNEELCFFLLNFAIMIIGDMLITKYVAKDKVRTYLDFLINKVILLLLVMSLVWIMYN